MRFEIKKIEKGKAPRFSLVITSRLIVKSMRPDTVVTVIMGALLLIFIILHTNSENAKSGIGEIVSNVAQVSASVIGFLMAYVAFKGINTWQKQILFQRKFEISTEVYKKTQKARKSFLKILNSKNDEDLTNWVKQFQNASLWKQRALIAERARELYMNDIEELYNLRHKYVKYVDKESLILFLELLELRTQWDSEFAVVRSCVDNESKYKDQISGYTDLDLRFKEAMETVQDDLRPGEHGIFWNRVNDVMIRITKSSIRGI